MYANLSERFSRIDMDVITMTKGLLNYTTIMKMDILDEIKDKCLTWFDEMLAETNRQSIDSSERVVKKSSRIHKF